MQGFIETEEITMQSAPPLVICHIKILGGICIHIMISENVHNRQPKFSIQFKGVGEMNVCGYLMSTYFSDCKLSCDGNVGSWIGSWNRKKTLVGKKKNRWILNKVCSLVNKIVSMLNFCYL